MMSCFKGQAYAGLHTWMVEGPGGLWFPQGFLSLEYWISPCLSELDKAMEKVRLWLVTGREA